MTNQKYSRWVIPILIGILLLQTFFMVYFGMKKEGYHDDEMATYTLSNYKDGFIIRSKGLITQWVDGDVLFNTLTVSDDESFDYKTVYKNQEKDVHPPLYYYIIHTISSLFRGRFSKWIGIVPNIVFCLLTSVFLFLIAKQLLKNDFLAIVTVLVWAFSIGAVDTVTLIRMYAMLTFLVVFFVFLHLKTLDRIASGQKISLGLSALLFLCCLAGLLTQYYFSVFALFLCGTFLLYMLFTRKWKEVLIYFTTQLGALAVSVLYYPAMLTHIFGSGYRGKEAFENLKNIDNFADNLKKILKIISNDILNGWAKELFLICLVLLAVAVLKKFVRISLNKTDKKMDFKIDIANKKELTLSFEASVICVIATVLLLYTALISKVAPYQRDRYYMCLYPLFFLCFVYTVYKICNYLFKKPAINNAITIILICTITVFGLLKQEPSYLYVGTADRADALEDYSDLPAIVLNDAYDWYATAWLPEYNNYPEVYIGKYKSKFTPLDNASETKDLSDGFIVYLLRFSESDEEIIRKIKEHIPLKECKKICDGDAQVFYCVPKE